MHHIQSVLVCRRGKDRSTALERWHGVAASKVLWNDRNEKVSKVIILRWAESRGAIMCHAAMPLLP